MLRPRMLWDAKLVSESVALSAVIAEIYDAAVDPALWQQALARICNFVGGTSAVLYWHDAATERSEIAHIFNESAEYTRLYFEKYLPMNPMFPAATFIDEGVVSTSDDIIPRAELVETRIYKEWIKPQGIEDALSVNLEKGVARVSLINVRTDRAPDQGMRERMALLVPHLQRAVMIGRLFDQGRTAQQTLTTMLDHVEAAVFLVGAQGAISFANDPGKQMLEKAIVVRALGSELHAIAADADRILQDIFTAAANGDASVGVRGVAVSLTNHPEEPWFAHVLPLTSGRRQEAGETNHAVAAIFIRKTAPNAPPPLEAIAKLYKLTATEVRVLATLLQVNGVKAMAESLGLSQATVKTHLHNLFRKTGTAGQSDLVKLVAGL